MAALALGFNQSTQHTKLWLSRRSVTDETEIKDLLYGSPEGVDVGALEEGRITPANCPAVRSKPLVYTANSCRVWWHPARTKAAIKIGIDFG